MALLEMVPSGPVLLVLLIAGLMIGYVVLRRQMRNEIANLKQLIDDRMAAKPGEPIIMVPKPEAVASRAEPKLAPKEPLPAPKPEPVVAKDEPITPEVLAIIGAAIAQFIGAGARIRSTRLLSVPEGMNPWAQQGRVIIQASHNLGMR